MLIVLINADDIRIPRFSWEKIDIVSQVGEDLPEARKDYAIGYSSDQDKFIIFGGRTADGRILSDTWIFDMNGHKWAKPSSFGRGNYLYPPARYGMVYGNDQPTSNSYRNAFIITHGKGEGDKIYNDLWSFDFIREEWVELKPTGDIPAPRYDAVGGIDLTKYSQLNQLSTEYLILSHGKDNSKYFSDTYVLKLDGRSQQGDYSQLTAEWIKLNTNNAPELKDGVSGDVLSNDRLVIFGGCDEEKGICSGKGYFLDVNFDNLRTTVELNASWVEVNNDCIRPKEYAAAIRGSDQTVVDALENDRLIIYGGVSEGKYGADMDGEISIFDMDKKQFFGVRPSSKSNEFPQQTVGGKMISTKPKSGNNDGFSIILFGGQPIVTDKEWNTEIWKLDVFVNYTYYPNPPEGVTKTDCYVINKELEQRPDSIFNSSKNSEKEDLLPFNTFILAIFIAIPALVIATRTMNCFTGKWKTIFCCLGGVCLILAIINSIFSFKIFNSSLQIIIRIICIVLLLIYLLFPFIRPKQPDIDFSNDDVVNAAGVPVGQADREEKNNKKKLNNTSSSSFLIDASMKNHANTAPSSEDNESLPPLPPNLNSNRKYSDTNTNTNTNTITVINNNPKNTKNNINNKNGDVERQESFLSPIFINPSIKEEAGEDEGEDGEDSYVSEIEDEDEIIKKQYLAHAKLWLMLLRIVGILLLISIIVLALVTVNSKKSRLNQRKIIVYIWIVLLIALYIIAVIIGRKKHTSMALRARKISFRPDEPLEPNRVNSWGVQADQMKRFSIVSDSSYGKTSAYDDIGNVSNYSQSVKNYNNNMAQSVAATNVPVIGGAASNASPTLGYSIPPLPVTPLYVNNNGLFSIDPSNYNKYLNNNPSQTPTTSSSLVNQAADTGVYKTSEITNIPASTSDYQSYKDVDMNIINLPLQQQQLQLQQQHSNQIKGRYSSSSLNSLDKEININDHLAVTKSNSKERLKTNSVVTMSNSNVSNPSIQSQVQLIPSNTIPYGNNINTNNQQGFQPSNNSSPFLEESPIQINTVDDQDLSLDFPQRNDTIEDMNDKEVMMVMTVPKRKLAVVNM